jgi:hypothetical protein
MRHSKAALTLLTALVAIGGGLFFKATWVEAKTSVLYCGNTANCKAIPYKPQGGWHPICATNSPCYLTNGCTGQQVCEPTQQPRAN